ncbi:MAG: CDP-diacylglycerol--serine O-phosphatidyltransferase [Acidobacteria bacterium]|nr:CDP-diacylglycerol--serine O-phosphatidyltransferase [Acidobacteriota bacterium]
MKQSPQPHSRLRQVPARVPERKGLRRGVSLLPSLFTLANLFCGWACVVHAMRGDLTTAAPFIGFAVVLDMLDGRIARMTGTASEFGVQLDSLADLISFGMAPAVLAFQWGLTPLGRVGWAAGFLFVTAAALRLARFNIQTHTDKRYFVGMPSPSAAAVPASTVFFFPDAVQSYGQALIAMAVVLVPAMLMVSTIRFRSFKSVDLGTKRSYRGLIAMAVVFAAIAARPHEVLLLLAYTYLLSAFAEMAWVRLRGRPAPEPSSPGPSSM